MSSTRNNFISPATSTRCQGSSPWNVIIMSRVVMWLNWIILIMGHQSVQFRHQPFGLFCSAGIAAEARQQRYFPITRWWWWTLRSRDVVFGWWTHVLRARSYVRWLCFSVISTSYTNPRKQIYFYLRVMSQMSTPQRLPGRHVPSKWSRWTSQLHQQIFVNWINCSRLKFLRHFFSFSLLFRHIHFRVINFYFFVVGHQKNNADKGNAKSGAQEIALRLRLCSMHSKINSR